MSSSPKKWRTSDGEQYEIKERPNIYECENYYDLIAQQTRGLPIIW